MKVYIKNKDANLSHLVIPILELLGGINKDNFKGTSLNDVYFIGADNTIGCIPFNKNEFKGYKELDLQALNDLILSKNKPIYPKVMLVYDKNSTAKYKRIVIGENPFTKRYIAISSITSIEDTTAGDPENITHWEYAEDIPESSIKEITLEEISEKFNIPIENIRIKK